MLKITKIVVLMLFFSAITGCNKGADTVTDENKEAGHAGHAGEAADIGAQCIVVDEASRKAMGLELKAAGYRTMENILEVTGEIAKDTERIFHVVPKTAGEVTEVKAAYGDVVKEGDVLAVLKTLDAAVELLSPAGGMITGATVKQGQHADEVTSLFTISDLSVISANFDIYEKDMGKIRTGYRIKVRSVAYPEKVFSGKIVFISPRVDEASRTIKIRAEIDNTAYLLKFSMYVTAKIITGEGQYLAIPSNALQKVKDKQIVFVPEGEKEFEAREITAGFEDNGYTQVLKGLKPGEKVAVKGSFLLKSELLKSEMGEGCAD
ncbi:MAG: hypothetical protein A2297_04920 [Elusimicrobia bacterium RIFOXYB2_FULL_48_7]|nr:MAG: hypothetical protein A2297_04920 [Elusimicrobia bacterium RIFOXYB2_FULL_48_7]